MQLSVILVVIDVRPPGTAIVVAGQDRRVALVSAVGPELHRHGSITELAKVDIGPRRNADRVVRSIKGKSERDFAPPKSSAVQKPARHTTDRIGCVAVATPPRG